MNERACCTPATAHLSPPDRREGPVHASHSGVCAGATPDGGKYADMCELPGGTFLMGADDPVGFRLDGEGPVRAVTLSPFSMDRYPVSNARFARFIEATGYRTEAEAFGWSFVFWSHIPRDRFHELADTVVVPTAPWWRKVDGAYWRQPEGPGSDVAARPNHPAVHLSWNDCQAFCRWAGKRLPTEAEWEYAARGGLEQKLYPWGDELTPQGRHMCNIWQGRFPEQDLAKDGYAGTCPVDAFPANGFGLFSLSGNTWEWCADWFSATFDRTAPGNDPKGPPGGQGRVMKGGSFLCHRSYCNRYRVAARTSNAPDSSGANLGFRCAMDMG